jgi:hypothetical protein
MQYLGDCSGGFIDGLFGKIRKGSVQAFMQHSVERI